MKARFASEAMLILTEHTRCITQNGIQHAWLGSVVALVIALLLQIGAVVYAQDLQWAKRAGGTGATLGSDIDIDASGNLYVTGHYSTLLSTPAIFGPGEPNETVLTSKVWDVYLAKYRRRTGELIWVKPASGSGAEYAYGIAVHRSGDSFVTGSFSNLATFGAGEANEITLTADPPPTICFSPSITPLVRCMGQADYLRRLSIWEWSQPWPRYRHG